MGSLESGRKVCARLALARVGSDSLASGADACPSAFSAFARVEIAADRYTLLIYPRLTFVLSEVRSEGLKMALDLRHL